MTNFNAKMVAVVAAKAAFATAAALVDPLLVIPAVVVSEVVSFVTKRNDQKQDNTPTEVKEVYQAPAEAPHVEVKKDVQIRPKRKKAQKTSDATQKTEQQKPRARRRQN